MSKFLLVACAALCLFVNVNEASAQATRIRMGGLFSGVRVKAGYGANVNASPCGVGVGWGGQCATGNCGYGGYAQPRGYGCGTPYCAAPVCAPVCAGPTCTQGCGPSCAPCGGTYVNTSPCGTQVYSPYGPTAVNVGAMGCATGACPQAQAQLYQQRQQTFQGAFPGVY